MKTLGVKTVMFGSYLIAVVLVWTSPLLSGFVALTLKALLVYCGLIVVAHLYATLARVWPRCLEWRRTACRERSASATAALETEGT